MNLSHINVIFFNIVCVSARGHGGHSGGGHGGHGGGHGGFGGHGSYGSHGYHGTYHSGYSAHTYSYHPPSHITYTCRSCAHPAVYPVYHGQPPAYVYMYRDSSNRYGDLLTGLALYNLGRSSSHHESYNSHHYTPIPDEKCSLQVIDKSHFEETGIDCVIMSSFLSKAEDMKTYNSSSKDITSSETTVRPTIDNGYRLKVTNDQVCMLWHNRTMVKERTDVPCALLKDYAETIVSSGVPVYIWLPTLVGIVITISLCCHYCKKPKDVKEEAPLNHGPVIGYCSNVRVE